MSCCRRTHTPTPIHNLLLRAALTRMWRYRYRCEAVKMVINHGVKWVVPRCGRTCAQSDSFFCWRKSGAAPTGHSLGWASTGRYTYVCFRADCSSLRPVDTVVLLLCAFILLHSSLFLSFGVLLFTLSCVNFWLFRNVNRSDSKCCRTLKQKSLQQANIILTISILNNNNVCFAFMPFVFVHGQWRRLKGSLLGSVNE